jgi:hypothetical protein
MTDELQYIENISYNAQKWADYFLENPVIHDDRYAETLRRTQRQILLVIRDFIKGAISGHKEYARFNWMQSELITAFNNPDIIRVDPETGVLYLFVGAEEVVGDWEDFWTGYEAALAERAPNAWRASDEKRQQVWREIVWPSDYLLSRTLAVRRRAWGNKAPWWNWLEVGNVGLEGAFPENNPATSFLYLAQDKARQIFNAALEVVENEEFNAIEQAHTRFILDPDKYEPYDVLGEFYAEGKKYKIYITPKRALLGVTEARRLGR